MYHSLCLSGGGVNGFIHLGMLQKLHELNDLSLLKVYSGTSIGALISVLILIGMTPMEIYDIFIVNFDSSLFSFEDIASFFSTFGMESCNYFMAKIVDIFVEKGVHPLMTFQELAQKYKKRLIVTGTNTCCQKCDYFSDDTFPDMQVLTAIRISISLPIIFSPVLFNECLYVDGFVIDNYPIEYTIKNYISHFHDNSKCKKRFNVLEASSLPIIGCYVINSVNTIPAIDFESFVFNLFMCAKRKEKQKNDYTITVDSHESAVNFDITIDEKKNLFNLGYNKCDTYLKEKKIQTRKQKRHSI
jgi:hypothetical protein